MGVFGGRPGGNEALAPIAFKEKAEQWSGSISSTGTST